MVHFNEGNPTTPGTATLEKDEVSAFLRGDVSTVRGAGEQFGRTCFAYLVRNPGETSSSDVVAGATALADSVEPVTLTTFRMSLPFLEGVQSGVSSERATIEEAAEWRRKNPGLYELYSGLAVLAEFGKNPFVQTEMKRREEETWTNLTTAVSALASSRGIGDKE